MPISSSSSSSLRKATQQQKTKARVASAWKNGNLVYKLRPHQKIIYDSVWQWIVDPSIETGCLQINRRHGKTYVLLIVATELAETLPGAQIRLCAPNAKEIKKAILPSMRKIFLDAPQPYRARWLQSEGVYRFPNGSEIHVTGVNNGRADDSRGSATHLALIDEAGFVDDLNYLIDSVLLPQVEDEQGTIVISSTPPRSGSHPFVELANEHKRRGHHLHRNIYDSDWTEDRIERKISKYPNGARDISFRREYLAELVTDTTLAVVPEWDPSTNVEPPRNSEYDHMWDRYESMDQGLRDHTVILFAQYHYKDGCLDVLKEWVGKQNEVTSENVVKNVRSVEKELWKSRNPELIMRWGDTSDANWRLDMASYHGLSFLGTSKQGGLESMLDTLKWWLYNKRIRISEANCPELWACLQFAVWNGEKNIGRDFARDKNLGHFDALAALIYLVRNVDQYHNPIPPLYGIDPNHAHIPPHLVRDGHLRDSHKRIKDIFRVQSPRKYGKRGI